MQLNSNSAFRPFSSPTGLPSGGRSTPPAVSNPSGPGQVIFDCYERGDISREQMQEHLGKWSMINAMNTQSALEAGAHRQAQNAGKPVSLESSLNLMQRINSTNNLQAQLGAQLADQCL